MATPTGQFRPWRLIWTFIGITAVLYGLVFLLPGANTPKLGIDLQGGTRITLTARTLDGSDPTRTQMDQARNIMESRVNGSGVAGAQVQIDGSRQLVITVPGTQDLNNLTRSAQLNIRPVSIDASGNPVASFPAGYVPPTTSAAPTSGSEATGSSAPTTVSAIGDTASPTPTVDESVGQGTGAAATTETAAPTAAASPSVVPAIGDTTTASPQGLRAAAEATDAPTSAAATDASAAATTPAGTDASATGATPTSTAPVAWPTGSNPENPTQPLATDTAGWASWLTAAQSALPGLSCADLEPYRGLDDPSKPLIACSDNGDAIYLLEPTIIAGTEISNATSGLDPQGGGYVVNLTFKSDGASTWGSYTSANVGKLTAMTLDGEVISAPRINSAIIGGNTQISGGFTQASASALANSLKFGSLPLAFDRAESVSVSAELGLEYLKAGIIAGGIGLLLVIIYCLIYYRLLGVITILSLVLSFGIVYAVLVLLGRWINYSLDMAGVAGLIIAIGITADSFVIYFERIKDEVREGRTFRSAVPRGWSRAKRTILSADAVSFLSAFILYILAVGEVKGFAFTLGLSTVLDLVVVFLVTHPLVHLASGSKIFQSPTWSGLGGVARAGARQRAATSRALAGAPADPAANSKEVSV
ncbi:protein translocase subunit SecD [Nakamurella flava]|uniref:Protein translocase subunit SecD n=1 Tax=Nakamurella flava TaxID=2576308 RepID=A0A4V6CW46_9ACTN|nr:protein translocase subunit SecD [Nakamurella flava]TKV60345.1 protein translocase subunit SecD [Nakamurella flava]